MLKIRNLPFEEDIEKATDEKNLTEDWAVIMHICDNATNYQDGAKYCFKAILKRLHHNVPRVVLQALTLLDACVKNCDRKFLLQVASSEFTNEVRKLLPKMHPSTAVKLKELIQKWSMEEFKDDPELCIIPSFYYKLVSEGVEFPPYEKNVKSPSVPLSTNPDAVNSQEEENDIIKAIEISLKDTGRYGSPSDVRTNGYPSSFTEEPLKEPFKVRVLFDFEAAEDNELTIKAGEIVMVVDNSNSSWWKGTNHRGEGLFPSNFVTENLDHVPEDPVTVTKTEIQDTQKLDNLEDKVVELDEKRIELAINWLNDTDPTGELPDSEEMLMLERDCYKMAPLIEEQLQVIDNRLAMLNLVNQKIMEAFETFHGLSSVGDNMYAAHLQPFAQPNFSTAMPMWRPVLQVGAPTERLRAASLAEPPAAEEAGRPRSGSIDTSTLPQSTMHSYYVGPGGLPFPNYICHGIAPGQPNYATLPYTMPMMFPMSGYLMNSTVTPSQIPAATGAPVPEQSQDPKPPSVTETPATPGKVSNYSQDLQNLTYGPTPDGQERKDPGKESCSAESS